MIDSLSAETADRDSAHTWTLITVTYNSAEQLRRHWRAPIPGNVRWIVIDNGSSDDSVQVAAEAGAEVVPLRENLGFGGANNMGYRMVRSPYVGFVNPDVTVDWNSLRMLEDVADQNSTLLSPQLTNPDGSLQPNGRGLPYLSSKIANRVNPRVAVDRYFLFAARGEIRDVDWMIGAVVLGRKAVFDRIEGPWDELFFVYYEDSDLGLRASREGVSSVVVGDARWVHGWARATSAFDVAAWRREFASMWKFYRRYPHLVVPLRRAGGRSGNAQTRRESAGQP